MFSAGAHEVRKPAKPGTGLGLTSEQMVSMQVSKFGASPQMLAPGRAFAAHSVPIGEPGREQECRVWHVVNQVAAWHHETLLFIYEPAPGKELDMSIVSLLNDELARCQFDRALEFVPAAGNAEPPTSRPWWRFW
jgi:hypothetical protein